MKTNRNILLDSGVLLAAMTAYLYCAGAADYGGYLRVLGLDPNVLDRDFREVLYRGFFVSVTPTLMAILVLSVGSFCYSHVVMIILADIFKGNWKRKRWLVKTHKIFRSPKNVAPTEARANRNTAFLFKLFVASFAMLLLLVHFESEGKQRAHSLIERVGSKQLEDSDFVTVQINLTSRKLVDLGCGARNCAGLDPSNWQVIYYPQGVSSYLLPNHPNGQVKKSK